MSIVLRNIFAAFGLGIVVLAPFAFLIDHIDNLLQKKRKEKEVKNYDKDENYDDCSCREQRGKDE